MAPSYLSNPSVINNNELANHSPKPTLNISFTWLQIVFFFKVKNVEKIFEKLDFVVDSVDFGHGLSAI